MTYQNVSRVKKQKRKQTREFGWFVSIGGFSVSRATHTKEFNVFFTPLVSINFFYLKLSFSSFVREKRVTWSL